MLDALELVRELVALPGLPGQEGAVRQAVATHAERLGCVHSTDARGNLLIAPPGQSIPEKPDVVVMAHLDEIALIVTGIDDDGRLVVDKMGGLFPWKWGEGPISILAGDGTLTGILSFGSIHTNSPLSAAHRAKENALTWDMTRIFTGLAPRELAARGVQVGSRVVLHPSRRALTEFGDFVAGPFLDDRADLAALLLALEGFSPSEGKEGGVLFAATASEETGGQGALYLLRGHPAAVGIALEIGPRVPESPFPIDANPTVWVNDGYCAMQASDMALVAQAADDIGLTVHWQALSRGGSDASCAAAQGLLARPITLAFPAENSHGCEIMHRDAVVHLALLLRAVLERLAHE